MATAVTCRAPAWVDGVQISGAEMRAAVFYGIWQTPGLVRGLRATQIPTPGMAIRVPAGQCVISDGQNGFIPLELAATTDLDIDPASLTNPRIDSLIGEFVDGGAGSIRRLRIITGTPAGSPSEPALPPADQPTARWLRIANIAVGAGVSSILTSNISTVADNARHHGHLFIRKSSNQSLPSSTTMQNDSALRLTIEPQTRYRFHLMLAYGVRSDTDGKVKFAVPANATMDWVISSKAGAGQADGNSGTPAWDLLDQGSEPRIGGWTTNNTSKMGAILQGSIWSGDGGDVILQWAQDTSNATPMIVYAGSTFEAWRAA
ncbi:hypothetical protein EDD29_0052 [Actinocorallia herbida]|uniref:Uncharacterized protein n=1 Tax=Actinocorallia herbida TaxID=58109 RepID=A0A3N1CMN9_9ACTN|nr:hypothetical protein [Actinocorallia herbida]ROO82572.1 hypothetical protein EDD29_0052 [Actinocorallia herbida]